MKISLITPTYNSEESIAKSINSVFRQTYSDFEHIIVDNQSVDNTLQIIKNLYDRFNYTNKLKIISEPDKGVSDAFNKGIKIAEGEVIAILNSDDYFFDTNVFSKAIASFEKEDILFVYGNIFFKDEIYGSNLRKPLRCKIEKAMPFNHPAMFFRKKVYEIYGVYDLDFHYAMDYEYICRLWNEIEKIYSRGVYISGNAFVVMQAGGISWKNEFKTIEESKKALIKNNLWNTRAKFYYYSRMFRTSVKRFLERINLLSIVRKWRNLKWN